MTKYIKHTNLLFAMLLAVAFGGFLSSCSESGELEEGFDPKVGMVVPNFVADVLDDDPSSTRASQVYQDDTKTMKFEWQNTDQIGVFNVFETAENSQNALFSIKPGSGTHSGTTASARFYNANYNFSPDYWWVCYYPYSASNMSKVTNYSEVRMTFVGQKQLHNAYPNPLIYYKNDGSGYSTETEALASQHLSTYDYLISDPSRPDDQGLTTFKCKHLGAIARFYTRFPEGAFGGTGTKGKVKQISLVYKDASTLVSDAVATINQQTSATAGTSYTISSTIKTQKLDLLCDDIEVPDYGYFVGYLMMYPVSVPENSCWLYITTTVNGVEKNFRSSSPLSAKTLEAGKLYRWTIASYDEPIELTATLQSWQDIVTGLSTDLEK